MAAEASQVQAAVSQAVRAPAANQAPSMHDRMKAILSAPSASPDAGTPSPSRGETRVQTRPSTEARQGDEGVTDDRPVPTEAEAEEDREPASEVEQSDDAQDTERQFSSVEELLEAAGLDSDRGLNLQIKTKIDGKEGTVPLRDLLKSYQTDGHLNQRFATLDTDRKALLADREKFNGERADKLLRLDAGVKTLERALMGQFANVNWEKLAAEDPAAYGAQLQQFQHHNMVLQDVARSISTEQQQQQAQLVEAQKAYLEEQRKLLQAKVPEWADESKRNKDKTEIVSYFKELGLGAEDFEALTDHRHALVVRDAWNWHKLQKSKPATLNKVKAAPKLLKPGSPQSKAARDTVASTQQRARFRQTGKMSDAVPIMKNLLFGGRS